MDQESFRSYLQGRNFPEDRINQLVASVENFEAFLRQSGKTTPPESATVEDFRAYSTMLIQSKLNTFDNYYALALYARLMKNNTLFVAAVEPIDGAEALDNLYSRVGKLVGEPRRDEIFQGIQLPVLGTPSTEKPRITQAMLERLLSNLDPETCKQLLAPSLRDLPDEGYLPERKKFLECKDLDEFLVRKGDDFIAELESIKRENRLYFTQEITDEVITFIQEHPEIRQGVHEGNMIYEAKIPYMAKEYLAESDPQMKRYYACHCMWVRESLQAGDVHVSPTFCQCSAGFHKKYWEMVFDRPLQADVLETVLQGNMWCKFAIHLPEDIL